MITSAEVSSGNEVHILEAAKGEKYVCRRCGDSLNPIKGTSLGIIDTRQTVIVISQKVWGA